MRELIVRTAFYRASAALAVLILVAGAMPSIAAAKTVEIKMTDTPPKFMPMTVTIQKGDTVEWINNAPVASFGDYQSGGRARPQGRFGAQGAKPFDSGFMPPGAKWSYTFHRSGHLQVPLPAARKGPDDRHRGGQIKTCKVDPRALPGGVRLGYCAEPKRSRS